jgi:hypothetical protein
MWANRHLVVPWGAQGSVHSLLYVSGAMWRGAVAHEAEWGGTAASTVLSLQGSTSLTEDAIEDI